MKRLLGLILVIVMCMNLAACAQGGTGEKPTELDKQVLSLAEQVSSFKTHGRVIQTADGLVCDESASGIEFNASVQGPVNVTFLVTADCYFTVYIDGVRQEKRICVLPLPEGYTAEIANFAEAGDHNILLLKETEAQKTCCTIVSVEFPGQIKTPPAENDILIEFLGDSITCGYGNLCNNNAENPGSPMFEDATQTYAVLAAQALGADFRLISCSGIGVAKGHVEPTMDAYFSAASYFRDKAVAYEPSRVPDVIVINLGTNDFGTNASDSTLSAMVPALIELIRDTYSANVPIVWAYGMMGTGKWDVISRSLDQNYYGADSGIYQVTLPSNFDGGGQHPNLQAHEEAAHVLSQYLKKVGLVPNTGEQVDTLKSYALADNASSFNFLGRTSMTNEGLICDQSATGIEFTAYMEGEVSVKVKTVAECYFTVYIDGVRSDERIYCRSDGNGFTAVIAKFDVPGEHTIQLLKQTEALKTSCCIMSVTFIGHFLEPPAEKKLLLEFLGDSITCGYGNLCQNGEANPGSTIFEDATKAYAVLTAQALDADFRLVSCSGIGVAKGHVEPTMADYFSAQNFFHDSNTPYTFDRVPDIVVINLGTNDGGTNANENDLLAAVPALIELVRSTYGTKVPIVWVHGMMGDGRWDTIRTALEQNYNGAEDGIYSVQLPANFQGGGDHPSEQAHMDASRMLVQYLHQVGLA